MPHHAITWAGAFRFLLGMPPAQCWAGRVIRRLLIPAASLTALLAALVAVWSHRYEAVPGVPVWRLADLRPAAPPVDGVEWIGTPENPALRLWVDEAHPEVALRLAIPGAMAADMLHLRYHLRAMGLVEGAERWQTGRMMIEWHSPDASGELEIDPVGGIVEDKETDWVTMVAVPARGPAIPALRLEHLGRAGEFTLSQLEILPVRERTLWKSGRWLLAAGFLAWLYACLRLWPEIPRWRSLAAALVWLLMGVHFVIPGPWKIQQGLLVDFRLGASASAGMASPAHASPSVVDSAAPVIESGAVATSGRLLPEGALALQVRSLVAAVRPLLHVLLLFAPTFASAWLVGRRPTLWLAIGCSCAIELAQVAFGFGFDWLDVLDLLTNALGIFGGLWLAGRFQWGPFRGWRS